MPLSSSDAACQRESLDAGPVLSSL
uniref:Uncharacterized protein n=1 Tax=Anguilla anguilla TaxID=7936 RepID=A0A0E9S0C1_ANGAN